MPGSRQILESGQKKEEIWNAGKETLSCGAVSPEVSDDTKLSRESLRDILAKNGIQMGMEDRKTQRIKPRSMVEILEQLKQGV